MGRRTGHAMTERGGVMPMPKAIRSNADALQALERYVWCQSAADAADHRAFNAGGSLTADRHRVTQANWEAKADAALDALRAYLGAAR